MDLRLFSFFCALELYRVISLLQDEAHRPAGLDVEADGHPVKSRMSERGLVNCYQTDSRFAGRHSKEFAILEHDVRFHSLIAFVFADVS